MPEPEVAFLPDTVYRVGRSSDLLGFSRISPQDDALPTSGNRYDVAGGGVLYVATELEACFAETLSRFRPTPKIRALLAEHEEENNHFMVVGGVPRDWRLKRSIAVIHASGPLPFLDVESGDTMAFLSERLASELVALGYDDNLTIGEVCNQDRRLSRAIARYAYTAADDEENFLYSGIRYCSKLDPRWECWAVFEGTDVYQSASKPIQEMEPALTAVADRWDLRVF